MSQIGSSVSQMPLAAPAAAVSGQLQSAERNQRQAEAGDRSFQINRDRQLEQTVSDVGDPGEADADRDADGRMAWAPGKSPRGDASDDATGKPTSHRAPDALEERGTRLDVEA